MKKIFTFLLLVLAVPAFCGEPRPKYHSNNPFVSTDPVMFNESDGWRLDAGEEKCAILRTGDGGRHWIDVSPPSLPGVVKTGVADGSDFFASLDAVDAKRAWAAMMVPFKKVMVDFTADGGRHWSESSVPITTAESVYICFPDAQHGFLLAVSDPAMGTERRWLYGTDDGAKHWHLLAPPGGGFPTGITFRTPLDGWSTAVYTGVDFVPFYCTHDGGKTWQHQKLLVPREFAGGYVDTEPPVFTDPEKKHGYLPAYLAKHNSDPLLDAYINYETNDGGATWHLPASGVKIIKQEHDQE
jgi:photosystem II stability/assembly factor-like uncharacterized protein